jgi:cytochrome c oxidase cbb3-type subunit III
MVTATAKDGERYQGIIRNEDNFSLQLQSMDGTFHFLSKADLKTIDRSQESIMPSDYGSKLSAAQLNDLISYLLSLGQASVPAEKHSGDDD